MQETKYYCDRCKRGITQKQHTNKAIGVDTYNTENDYWIPHCKQCEKEIIAFITKKPKTTNTKTK